MSSKTKVNHIYFFGGSTIIIIAFLTLIIESIPAIWIGGFFIGSSMIFKDIYHFSTVQNSKNQNLSIQIVSDLYHFRNYEETLAVIDNLKYDTSLSQSQKHYLHKIEAICWMELDNQKFNGLIKDIEKLFKDDIIEETLEIISKIKSFPFSMYTTHYLYSLEARCHAKLNNYSQALKITNKLLDFGDYIPRAEDYIFKAHCEMKLYNLDIASQTIKKALNIFPKDHKLLSFQKELDKSMEISLQA